MGDLKSNTLIRKDFMAKVSVIGMFPDWQLRVIVVAVEFPNGSIETITNHGNEQVREKIKYYTEKYDDSFALKANQDIRIVGYMIV